MKFESTETSAKTIAISFPRII